MAGYNALSTISNNEIFKQFVHATIDDLVKKNCITYNTFYNEIEWTKQDYLLAVKTLQDLFQNAALKSDFNLAEEIDDLLDLSKQECIVKCFNVREQEIFNYLIELKYSAEAQLMTDFDWRVKLVMGSAKLSNFVEPLVQLNLQTCESNHNETNYRNINMEMNKTELEELITALQSGINAS
ncbi:COMM domain-containing protein 8-like [Chrysoperla carnea]|uniref:COMM domain-containing protein 8-like n=1 Tax=Chrysoperla carnea TaxID=189513 RepID=UPI001D06A966|nr:COMM domain-containing protein 8-like [Chrysoperla carnea]